MRKRERKLFKNAEKHQTVAELQNLAAFGFSGRTMSEDINYQINFGQVPSKN